MAESAKAFTPLTQAEQKQAMKDGRLLAWKCETCGHKSVTPMYVCPKDASRKIGRTELPHEGEVVSFTVQKISVEEFINEVPFAFVVVKLTDGTLVSGWIADVASDRDLKLGQKVRHEPTYKPGVLFEKS